MKHARNNNKFELNSKHKEQTTISTIIYYPHKKQNYYVVIRF